MAINAMSMSLVIKPCTIIHIAVGVNKATLSIGFVFLPPAFVH